MRSVSTEGLVVAESAVRTGHEVLDQQPIFVPRDDRVASSQLTAFISYVKSEASRNFLGYQDFEGWAADHYRDFWRHFSNWAGVIREGCDEPVCTSEDVQSAQFFPHVRLSYAENLLSGGDDDGAVIGCTSHAPPMRLTRGELRTAVARTAVGLREIGLREGDRVVAVVRSTPDAVVVALATAALGATFSSAAPDMGALSTLARFRQLQPTLLVAHLGNPTTGSSIKPAQRIAEIAAGLPTLRSVVALERPDGACPELPVPVHVLADLQAGRSEDGADFLWPRFAFNHPLFLLFTSGTTGQPKCIVHGAGGTLLEHLKEHRLHGDLRRGDRLFFQTSAAWMMWNWQLSALACGAEILLYDGPRCRPPNALASFVGEHAVTVFGTSPSYLRMCQDTRLVTGAKSVRARRAAGPAVHRVGARPHRNTIG